MKKIPPAKTVLTALIFGVLAVCAICSPSFSQSSWSVLPDLPEARENHITTGWKNADTNYIIIAGGRINNDITGKVIIYNTVSGSYRELAPMPVPVENAGGFVIGDSLYVVGGSEGGLLGGLIKQVYRLNLKTNTWLRKNDFPFTIGQISSSTVSIDSKHAYVVAGLNGILALNSVYLYNADTDTWSAATALPIIGLFGTSVGLLNDSTLFVAGGIRLGNLLSNTYIGKINLNNLLSILWSPGPSYPGGPVFNIGSWGNKRGRVFFAGGSRILDNSRYVSASGETYMYNEDENSFEELLDKPTPITHTQIYGYDSYEGGISHNEVYVPGGRSGYSAVDAHEKLTVDDSVRSTTNISISGNNIPGRYSLYQNYPNPFNPTTVIKFDVAGNQFVSLKLYDFLGREVRVLINSSLSAGTYEYKLNASQLPGGVYFYTVSMGEYNETRKMVLLK